MTNEDLLNDKSQSVQNEINEISQSWGYIWRDILTNGINNSPYTEPIYLLISLLFVKARYAIPCGEILYRARIMYEEDIIESNKRILNNANTSFMGFDCVLSRRFPVFYHQKFPSFIMPIPGKNHD